MKGKTLLGSLQGAEKQGSAGRGPLFSIYFDMTYPLPSTSLRCSACLFED